MAYDLPATLQYVHDQTGRKLHYVGHSQVNFHISFGLAPPNRLNTQTLEFLYVGNFDCSGFLFQRPVIKYVEISCLT